MFNRLAAPLFAIAMRSEEQRLNSSHTVIYTLSLHDALPICVMLKTCEAAKLTTFIFLVRAHHVQPIGSAVIRHCYEIGRATSELQSHSDLHSFPTRRSSDLCYVKDVRSS